MEVVEETLGANGHFLVVKGQRAKRPRPSPPSSLASTSSIGGASSGGGGEDTHNHGHGNDERSSSSAVMSNTEEDEDMANCLILLAQGRSKNNEQGLNGQNSVETREGLYAVYECKTCNRSFPSFQALGGHAASHKKPKAAIKEEKKGLGEGHFNNNNTDSDKPLVLQAVHHHMAGNNNNKSKVHECSICGSEFSSGQALGGHMRRHRNTIAPMAVNEEFTIDQKSRKVLGLDLNLPAPDEQPPLVFSAPALVDCHY